MLFADLLQDWGRGLRARQLVAPADPARHGALGCPACSFIHGRCMDALYPFLYLARTTGDRSYVAAATGVYDWAERNVSHADGSWTVIADPKSWKGISVFGAVALAEALHHHGDLLDPATRVAWTARLSAAADYVFRTFTIDFTNINYPATATHALHLCGEMLDRPDYQARARVLAREVMPFLSTPNQLLTGEGKPSDARSPRGRPPVDLGYNVEESLVALSLYARDAGDREIEDRLVDSWRGHLAFMLPDGAWDNSWGTRQAKWTYWGSRTCDGCQPGLAVLADRDPAFATAVIRNTELMRACTRDGLLYGGPHYAAAGAPPCVHHTFTHAKALAAVLDRGDLVDRLAADAPLPRASADGLREFPEVGVWLAARGPWRATVSDYDFLYRRDAFAATGGTLAMLWHRDIGPVFAASMARYVKVEANNMQDDPAGRDEPLTPRLETWHDGVCYSQLFDLKPKIQAEDHEGIITFSVEASLVDQHGASPPRGAIRCLLRYLLSVGTVEIRARLVGPRPVSAMPVQLVVPVVSPHGDAGRPGDASGGAG
jgi:hypothetical protein